MREAQPLTDYICALMRQTPDKLQRVNPTKAANHYGIRVEVAEYYLEQERNRRRAL